MQNFNSILCVVGWRFMCVMILGVIGWRFMCEMILCVVDWRLMKDECRWRRGKKKKKVNKLGVGDTL